MDANSRVAGGGLSRARIAKHIGCMNCGRQDVSELDVAAALAGGPPALCGRCRRQFRPTALDIVLDALGMSVDQFAEETGIPLRTVIRAARGERIGKASAKALARITGMPWQTWRPTA